MTINRQSVSQRKVIRTGLITATALIGLSGCSGFDIDFRDNFGGGFDTSGAVRQETAARPAPDNRGVISYPTYQVVVARRGDTIADVAARIGMDATELANYNGISPNSPLRANEIVALPRRVSEPGPNTGAITSGPIQPADQVDITTIAGGAIERSDATPTRLPPAQTGDEPVRHRVERGETAFSIARLYNVSVRSLADWNGLGTDLAVREGQFLLIPVAVAGQQTAAAAPVAEPGQGSPTPTPPSATQPLPENDTTPAAEQSEAPVQDLSSERTTNARLMMPVQGNIIRPFAPGGNGGIDIAAAAGSNVVAAADGRVAIISEDIENLPFLILRHDGNLLTVYANVSNLAVEKGDTVSRGQTIAKLRNGDPSVLRFEVRLGIEDVDPVPYLNP